MFFTSEKIERYAESVSLTPSPLCEELAEYTRKNVPMALMLTGPGEAGFLAFLASLIRAKRILEIGTFTGYASLAMAEQLPDGGELVTLDVSEQSVAIGRRFWERSPHGQKIHSVIGPALESLAKLNGPFDLVFIDAAKKEYPAYVEHALRMLSPQGVIAVDNTLYAGLAAVPEYSSDASAKAMSQFNAAIKGRKDLLCVMLPIRDGITLIKKA